MLLWIIGTSIIPAGALSLKMEQFQLMEFSTNPLFIFLQNAQHNYLCKFMSSD